MYEWENGVVYLISTGKSTANSYPGRLSANGDDVFFATTEGLVPGDTDGAYDVYDARVPHPGEPTPGGGALRRLGLPGPAERALAADPARERNVLRPRQSRTGTSGDDDRNKENHDQDREMQKGLYQEEQQMRQKQEEEDKSQESQYDRRQSHEKACVSTSFIALLSLLAALVFGSSCLAPAETHRPAVEDHVGLQPDELQAGR